jgi:osmoprotectant transport system permease protein
VNLHTLVLHLLEHIGLVLGALIFGLVIALPIGIAAARSRYKDAVIAALGVLYTIPSLALFALAVPLLGLGFQTAESVLTVYAVAYLARSVVTSLLAIPTDARECAIALGYSHWQRFVRVELPLASPLLMSGIRTTTIMLIATASIAAWVDGGGLGVILFQGLHQDDMQRIAWGCAASAAFAIMADAGLSALERRLRRAIQA